MEERKDAEAALLSERAILAVARSDMPAFEATLKEGVDVNRVSTITINDYHTRQTTALFEAVVAGDLAMLSAVLACADLDVNQRAGQFKHTPLSYAADVGADKVVELLLADSRVDVNAGADGLGGPFALAATKGRLAVVTQLLDRDDVDVNAVSRQGYPPLAEAVRGEHEDVVKALLVDGRVDVNKESEQGEGVTPLVIAVQTDQRSVVQDMIDCGRVDFDAQEDKFGLMAQAKEAGYDAMFSLLENFFLTAASMGELDTDAQFTKLRYAFDKLDKDKRGYITVGQLGELAESVGTVLEPAELTEACIGLDTSKNGRIEFDELQAFWLGE